MAKKILVVDDEIDIQEMLKIKLESAGYSVVTADNGLTALSQAQDNHPDLLILDLMLPKINGFRVCSLLKKDVKYSSIPIIILTARSGLEDEKLANECGANLYLTKPLDLNILLVKIKDLIGV
jgi:DNA-binding response OmpR family regulator